MFKQRFGGFETLSHSADISGGRLLVWAVEAGTDYRLYGFCTRNGALEPMSTCLPTAAQWAQLTPPSVAARTGLKGSLHGRFKGRAELHVMFREDRLTSTQALPELRRGEWLRAVFNAGLLAPACAQAPVLRRFNNLYRLEGASSSERLLELGVALERRADVEYCSLDPALMTWHAEHFAELLYAVRPGLCLAVPWRYPAAFAPRGAAAVQSKLIWDCMLGCTEAQATVFYSPGSAMPGWGHNGAIGVPGVRGAGALQQKVAYVNALVTSWAQAYPGSYLPPNALRAWLGDECQAQALASLEALLAG
ncbi:hypothetical protein [Pseudomonas typographi]|uniref:Uncharacterized protein n=1 Tax=Pseudomonas typographi TaxID=2715964 RepID=A0ABR7Z159_9PSED|nr:hypothetical protein [Pseudomonas typographi]MBD1551754.1 hypothetical protein [Pseudomonas typographi]MBD1586991.1 hypothetical protein [Pseudomonas typographi]MBD1599231.1 hypothetical protein [Pseudomonas typographi]